MIEAKNQHQIVNQMKLQSELRRVAEIRKQTGRSTTEVQTYASEMVYEFAHKKVDQQQESRYLHEKSYMKLHIPRNRT